MSLGAGVVRTVELACVRKFPYVVAWDAEHHEHIGLALVSALPDRSAVVTAATVVVEPESVTVHATLPAEPAWPPEEGPAAPQWHGRLRWVG